MVKERKFLSKLVASFYFEPFHHQRFNFNQLSKLIEQLKEQWTECLTSLNVEQHLVDRYWQMIEQKYGQQSRKYHNLQHLKNMFDELEKVKMRMEDLAIIQLSIWFHDIIYQAVRKDNERKSAELAEKALTEFGLLPSRIQRCFEQIMLTKKHQLTTTVEEKKDEKWLIDFDLEILSRDWSAYQMYSQQIREEYWMYPNLLYNKGRKTALQQFLQRPFIYQTDHYRRHNEAQARANIQKEIEILTQ